MVDETTNSDVFVDGVGNEVFYSLTFVIAVVFPLLFLLWTYRHHAFEAIPPAQRALVDEALGRFRAATGGEGDGSRVPRTPSAPEEAGPTAIYLATDCAICYNPLRFAVQTNCGHFFCAQCIITYWQYGAWQGAVNCPICRTQVTLLLECFTEADPNEPGRLTVSEDIRQYNRRFSGEPRSLMDYLRDVPVLLPHLLAQFFSVNGLMWMFRVRVSLCLAIAVAYLLSPFDILPEAVFGLFGLLDDLFILLIFLLYLTVAYRHFIAGE